MTYRIPVRPSSPYTTTRSPPSRLVTRSRSKNSSSGIAYLGDNASLAFLKELRDYVRS
jgi:hypothetical protein